MWPAEWLLEIERINRKNNFFHSAERRTNTSLWNEISVKNFDVQTTVRKTRAWHLESSALYNWNISNAKLCQWTDKSLSGLNEKKAVRIPVECFIVVRVAPTIVADYRWVFLVLYYVRKRYNFFFIRNSFGLVGGNYG